MSQSMSRPASAWTANVDRWKAIRAWSTLRRYHAEGFEAHHAMRGVLIEAGYTSDKAFERAWIAFHAVYWTTKNGVEAMGEALAVAASQAMVEVPRREA